MFMQCGLTSLNVSMFGMESLTSSNYMFGALRLLTTIVGLGNWNVSKLVNADHMFYAGGMLTLDLSNWKLDSVQVVSSMFLWCFDLESIGNITSSPTQMRDMSDMFYLCHSIEGVLPFINNWNMPNLETMDSLFRDCKSMTEYANPAQFWNNPNTFIHESAFLGSTLIDNYADIPLDWKSA